MPTLVSTGQITIVDTNDARSITAALVANSGTQQVYSKDESTVSFLPSWVSANLTITPQISVGGMSAAQAWAALTNKSFALTAGGTALTTATTSNSFVNDSDVEVSAPFTVTHAVAGSATPSSFVVKANLKATVAQWTLFFDADFVDPATSLSTHITCQITLGVVKTGTNAVYIMMRGQTNIEEATGATKNNIAIAADLIRSSGIDTSGLTYKWFEAGGSTQITTAVANYATEYGLSTSAAGSNPTPGTLGANIPSVGTGNAFNTLTINESAVSDIGIFKVEITDSDAKTYSQYFTIYDISDPYDTQILSSSGDKLQNGQGSTTLVPIVYYGSTQVSSLVGWTFDWTLYNKNGKRAAFIDTGKITTAGGANINANTTGTSASFTYGGTSYAFQPGDIIKCVKPNGDANFYEVQSSSANNVVIRSTPTVNTWLSFADYPAPATANDFANGKIFGCTSNGGIRSTSGNAAVVLTGDEVDVKARILVQANRP